MRSVQRRTICFTSENFTRGSSRTSFFGGSADSPMGNNTGYISTGKQIDETTHECSGLCLFPALRSPELLTQRFLALKTIWFKHKSVSFTCNFSELFLYGLRSSSEGALLLFGGEVSSTLKFGTWQNSRQSAFRFKTWTVTQKRRGFWTLL